MVSRLQKVNIEARTCDIYWDGRLLRHHYDLQGEDDIHLVGCGCTVTDIYNALLGLYFPVHAHFVFQLCLLTWGFV